MKEEGRIDEKDDNLGKGSIAVYREFCEDKVQEALQEDLMLRDERNSAR